MSVHPEGQPEKTIVAQAGDDKILRCHYCSTKLGTYNNESLDLGGGEIEDPQNVKCKKCGRRTEWRPSHPRRR